MDLEKVEGIEQEMLPPGHSGMFVLDKTGDTKIIWSRDNQDEVANARRTFDDLIKKGYTAFSVVGKNGDKGEKLTGFDAEAERMILVPPMKGG